MARTDGPVSVCVINLKGGVGKSTIATLLARRAFPSMASTCLPLTWTPKRT